MGPLWHARPGWCRMFIAPDARPVLDTGGQPGHATDYRANAES
ncbi:MAG: hypothetical protein R2719_05120 [Micropruina sp.]